MAIFCLDLLSPNDFNFTDKLYKHTGAKTKQINYCKQSGTASATMRVYNTIQHWALCDNIVRK